MNRLMSSINRVYTNWGAPDSLRNGRRKYSFSKRLPGMRLGLIAYASVSRLKYRDAIISRRRALPQRVPRISAQSRIGRLAKLLGVMERIY